MKTVANQVGVLVAQVCLLRFILVATAIVLAIGPDASAQGRKIAPISPRATSAVTGSALRGVVVAKGIYDDVIIAKVDQDSPAAVAGLAPFFSITDIILPGDSPSNKALMYGAFTGEGNLTEETFYRKAARCMPDCIVTITTYPHVLPFKFQRIGTFGQYRGGLARNIAVGQLGTNFVRTYVPTGNDGTKAFVFQDRKSGNRFPEGEFFYQNDLLNLDVMLHCQGDCGYSGSKFATLRESIERTMSEAEMTRVTAVLNALPSGQSSSALEAPAAPNGPSAQSAPVIRFVQDETMQQGIQQAEERLQQLRNRLVRESKDLETARSLAELARMGCNMSTGTVKAANCGQADFGDLAVASKQRDLRRLETEIKDAEGQLNALRVRR